MKKRIAYDTAMLLGAIELWSMSDSNKRLPDHVYDGIAELISILRSNVLDPQHDDSKTSASGDENAELLLNALQEQKNSVIKELVDLCETILDQYQYKTDFDDFYDMASKKLARIKHENC
jgi:hypothetical protein